MNGKHWICAAAVLALSTMQSLAADVPLPPPAEEAETQPVPPPPAPLPGASKAEAKSPAEKPATEPAAPSEPRVYMGANNFLPSYSANPSAVVGRFGWWSIDLDGSPIKVGEYQDLEDSPFLDVDGLVTDGRRTLDFSGTSLSEEGRSGRLNFYGPALSVKADYDQYWRHLDFDTFDNFNPFAPPAPAAQQVLNHDVQNDDYAFRVQEFSTKFKGNLTEDVKWRLNVWGIQRQGIRQANKLGHCFNEASPLAAGQPNFDGLRPSGNRCHILAQSQRIDWATVEIEPVIEMPLGPFKAEYSRTMRFLDTDDQTVSRFYTATGHQGWPVTGRPVPYNFTTENYTQIDRLKLSTDLNDYNHFYGLGFFGNTKNEFRDTRRTFNGFDLRLTNDRIDGLTMTGYAKMVNEYNQLPSTFPESALIQGGDSIDDYHHPINYERTTAGLKSRWVPFDSGWNAPRGLAMASGYEYGQINRDYAEYELELFEPPAVNPVIAQPTTTAHTIYVGPQMRWSSKFDTYMRYKLRFIDDPLFGVRLTSGDVNSNLPDQSHLVEFGGTWMPTDNFMLMSTIGIESLTHNSVEFNPNPTVPPLPQERPLEFTEDNYPFTISAWYAPTQRLSLTAGYFLYTNFIDQLITLGDQYDDGVFNPGARNYFETDPAQGNWTYDGRAQVVSLGGGYCVTSRLKFNGGFDFGRNKARITSVATPATSIDPLGNVVTPNWSQIPGLSAVVVDTTRFTAGFDYALNRRWTTYGRYVYFDYEDKTKALNSGTSHGILGGVSATF